MLQEVISFISNHCILSFSWITLLYTVSTIVFKSYFSKIKEISCYEATRLINKEDAIVVDIRSGEDFSKGHLVNAANLTALQIKSGHFGDLEKHKKQPIIVICYNGSAAYEPAKNLNIAGFKHIVTLKEGIIGWNNEKLPLICAK